MDAWENANYRHPTENVPLTQPNLEHPYRQAHTEDPELGTSKAVEAINKRKTTDCCAFLCSVAFWIGMIWVTYVSVGAGDPRRLYHGMDYKGQLCGVDEAVVDKPMIYWPRPSLMRYPVCMGDCPADDSQQVPYPHEEVKIISQSDTSSIIQIETKEMMTNTYASSRVAGRFCLPTEHTGRFANFTESVVSQQTGSIVSLTYNIFDDLASAWLVLLFMLPLAFMLSYVYMLLVRYCARILTWGVVLSLIGACATFAVYCFKIVGHNEERAEAFVGRFTEDPVWLTMVIGYVAAAVTGVLLLLLCCLCGTIKKVVGCIEASCDCIWALPMLFTVPVVDIFCKVIFTVGWLVCFTWVVTNGEVVAPTAEVNGTPVSGLVRKFQYTNQQLYCIIYYVFGLFWVNETITQVTQFVISYSVSIWYFTPCRHDFSKPEISQSVYGTGLCFALRYHMGTLSLSACVISVFRLCHAILEFIAQRTKGNNPVAHCNAKVCICCVWCFEEVVRYLNKNAIIQLVLKPADFFTCAGAAFKLLASAATDVYALNGITTIFQLLGVAFITATGTWFSFTLTGMSMYSSKDSDVYLENRIVVVVFCGIICMMVASAFMHILDMVSDTLLFDWLVDADDGVTEFAPKAMRDLLKGQPKRGLTGGQPGG